MPDAALFPKAGSPAHHATLRPQLFSAYLPSPSPTALPAYLPLHPSPTVLPRQLTPPILSHSYSLPTYPPPLAHSSSLPTSPLQPSPAVLHPFPSKHRKAPGSSPEASPNLLFQIQPTGHREPNTAAYPMPAMPGLFAHF